MNDLNSSRLGASAPISAQGKSAPISAQGKQALVPRLEELYSRIHTTRSRLQQLRGSLYGHIPETINDRAEVKPSGYFASIEDGIYDATQALQEMCDIISELEARIIG